MDFDDLMEFLGALFLYVIYACWLVIVLLILWITIRYLWAMI